VAQVRQHRGGLWSEMDIADLTHSLDYGDTFAQTASSLVQGRG
jgi:hypothetical protein